MPRLTPQQYFALHSWLAELWAEHQVTFGLVSPREQWYLHDYFAPSQALSEEELLTRRKQVAADRPSLPQCAGRAVRKLHARLKAAQAHPVTTNSSKSSSSGRGHAVVRAAVVNPQIDVDRLVRGLLRVADDLGRTGERDESHDSPAA